MACICLGRQLSIQREFLNHVRYISEWFLAANGLVRLYVLGVIGVIGVPIVLCL